MVKPVREAYESHVDCGLYEGRERKYCNKNCSVVKVKGMVGPLRTSHTEAGMLQELINVCFQSILWIMTTYYFYEAVVSCLTQKLS